jgi:hypothetical protein
LSPETKCPGKGGVLFLNEQPMRSHKYGQDPVCSFRDAVGKKDFGFKPEQAFGGWWCIGYFSPKTVPEAPSISI